MLPVSPDCHASGLIKPLWISEHRYPALALAVRRSPILPCVYAKAARRSPMLVTQSVPSKYISSGSNFSGLR